MSAPHSYYSRIIPLRKFKADCEISLDRCRIRRLSQDEKRIIVDSVAFQMAWGAGFGDLLRDVDFVIASELSEYRTSYDVVAALRVFKPKPVQNLPEIVFKIQNGNTVHVQSCDFWMSLYETTTGVYRLSADEGKEFREFWHYFSGVKDFPFMRTAIERFSNVYRKGFQGDLLIDYMIALEALFSDNSEGIGYKLGCRVPVLACEKIEERKRTREYVRTAYQIRSKLVHGSQEPYEKIVPKEMKKLARKVGRDEINFDTHFLIRMREIVQTVIYRYVIRLSEGRTRIAILENLDNSLMGEDSKTSFQE